MRIQHWPGPGFDHACLPALRHGSALVWQLYRQLLDGADAFADVPVPFLYREIHAACPRATYVLLKRRPEGWIKSVRHHSKGRELAVLDRMQYREICGKDAERIEHFSDRDLFYGYERFIESVANWFIGNGAKFILLEIEHADLSARLGSFLGFDPGITFPRIEHSAPG